MSVIDISGFQRSDKEVYEIINDIKRELVKGKVYPIMIQFSAIIECLNELLFRRRVMDRQEEEVENMSDVYDGVDYE